MQKFNVLIEDTGEHFPCSDARSLLEGMVALDRKGIPLGCRNGGCGVCKVAILSGAFVARVMSRSHVSEDDERVGKVLACRVQPASDIRLMVLGGMKKKLCQSDRHQQSQPVTNQDEKAASTSGSKVPVQR
ncbi:MAG: 2Fe-2S iron-sulfur cluster binding domain-containing protein [Hydrogenophaga sp.]|uniref:2Fe-2S iron-sulfur cluster binding domain-containing protein n=1 Tax=Hydrogenophaga sp. TaxID=1904254 RepID=UPI002718BD5C|nr:2Fe-2S iron-sulfur cluster binding domain-containing protein [Hydrogenophaga sp.]MDO9029564.1 2Fe-2S iron-sulfur cluster binding domain-containing protein [Hydrogenophaga sp.]